MSMRSIVQKKLSKKQLRFVIVGVINTIIDFSIFSLLVGIGYSSILANYISTTTALCFSFVANKNYTFERRGKTHVREISSFLVVTLIGLWLLQPLIIKLTQTIFKDLFSNQMAVSLGAKVLATVVSLVWNYLLYDKVVFRKKPEND